MFDVVEKSFVIPSTKVSDGKSILLNAATEPLIPIRKMPKTAIAKNNVAFGLFLKLNGFPPLANHAVNVRKASKINVLVRCPIIQNGRAAVNVSAVFPVKTSPAPTNASVIIKTNEINAVLRIALPFGNFLNAQITKIKTAINAKPLVRRCENSMTVLSSGALGITSP